MSVERLINFEDSMPQKSNSWWDSLFLYIKFSSLTKYIFEKINFSTNNVFLVKTHKTTMACQWVPYYLVYKVLEVPEATYKVWIFVQKARCSLKDVFSYSSLHIVHCIFMRNQPTTSVHDLAQWDVFIQQKRN